MFKLKRRLCAVLYFGLYVNLNLCGLLLFSQDKEYPFFGTMLDTKKNLEISLNMVGLIKTAGEVAGQMALRLVHDHLLRLNVEKYTSIIRKNVVQINGLVINLQSVRLLEEIRNSLYLGIFKLVWILFTLERESMNMTRSQAGAQSCGNHGWTFPVCLLQSGRIPRTLKMQWLMSALGSYSRASKQLLSNIQNSDLEDYEQCRIINNRIMGVNQIFLIVSRTF